MNTSLLKNKSFVSLLVAQIISSIGDWLSLVAIFSLVGLRWHASPFEMSLVILSLAVPMSIFGPIGGVFADRIERKSLMIASDIIRGILILVISFASQLYVIYVCLFLTGLLSALFMPAKNAKLKEIVPDDQIKEAMAMSAMIDAGSKVIGPLTSGLLVSLVGITYVFYIDSTTFLISALIIMFLPKSKMEPKNQDNKSKTSIFNEMKQGFQYVRLNAFLFYGMILLAVSMLILQLADSQIVILFRELSNVSPSLLGAAITGTGTGMLVTGGILSKKSDYPAFLFIITGVIGLGASFGGIAFLTMINTPFPLFWAPTIAFLAGISGGLVFIPFESNVQVETPGHMTGRVFGLINSIIMTVTVIGPVLGGWLATKFGIIPTFMTTSSLLVVIGLVAFLNRRMVERSDNRVTENQRTTERTTAP